MGNTDWMEPAKVPTTRPCPKCDGTKKVLHPQSILNTPSPCTFCHGTGTIPMEKP